MFSVNIYFQLQYIISAHTLSTTPPSLQWVYLNTNNILSWKDKTVGIHNNIRPKIDDVKISSTTRLHVARKCRPSVLTPSPTTNSSRKSQNLGGVTSA